MERLENTTPYFAFICACLIAGLAMILDAPWGNPFYSYAPITEIIGFYYFASLDAAFSLPGVSVSLFESLSLFTALLGLVTYSEKHAYRLRHSAFGTLLCLIPAGLAAGIVSGFAEGNSFPTMLTQTRALATLPIWTSIGFTILNSPSRCWSFIALIGSLSVLKSLQGVLHYIFSLNRSMGRQEYLIEHISSHFMTTSGIAIIAAIIIFKTDRVKLYLLALMSLPILGLAFLLNDRRSALVGLALAVLIGVLALPKKTLRRIWPYGLLGAMASFLYVVTFWNAQGLAGFPARTFRSFFDPNETSGGYRKVEDANLLLSVASDPLFGIGFGRRFSVIYPMPNIANFYEEYDLVPHNNLLFLWAFAGPFGLACFGAFIVFIVASGIRLARTSSDPKIIGIACIACAAVIKSIAYVYADLGLREVRLLAEIGAFSGCILALSRYNISNSDPFRGLK